MEHVLSCNCCNARVLTRNNKRPSCEPPPPEPPVYCCNDQCACEDAWVRVMVHLALFLYAFSFYLQHCASMLIAEELKIDKTICNLLIFILKIGMAITCLPYGRYGDLCCACRALKAAYIACIVSYVMTLASWSPAMFYASRIPHLMFHCHLGSQMLLTESTCDFHRTLTLSFLGLVFRAGSAMGSLIGPKIIAGYGSRNAVFLACLGSMFAFLIILKKVPCRREGPDMQVEPCMDTLGEIGNPSYFWNLFRTNGIWLFILMKVVIEIPVIALYVLMRFIIMEFYGLEVDKSYEVENYILISDLVLHALAVAVIYLLQSDILIIKSCLWSLSGAYLTVYLTEELNTFMGAMAVLACSNAVLSVTLSSVCTKLVNLCQIGAVLGMNMATFLLIMEAVPMAFTSETIDTSERSARMIAFNGAISSMVILMLFSFIARLRRRNPLPL